MKAIIASLIVLPLFTALPAGAQAQTISEEARQEIEISRSLINDRRNTLLARNMQLSDSEREAFWPLYSRYRDAMANVAARKLDVIIDYATHVDDINDQKASELLDRWFLYERQALEIKNLYTAKFRQILPGKKVARLMQMENRMDAAIALKIAEGVPLVD